MNILRKNRKSNYKYNKRLFRRIMIFIFSLIITTFAWVTYSKLLNDEMDIHIVSWDLEYLYDPDEDGTLEDIGNPLEININSIYPQMEDLDIEITVRNNGEALIDLSCLLTQISILGTNYQIVTASELATENDYIVVSAAQVNAATNKATQDLLNDTETFPFTISLEYDTVLEPGEDANITVTVSWDGTNDDLDTEWGYNVAQYLLEEDPESILQLVIQVNSVQARPSI